MQAGEASETLSWLTCYGKRGRGQTGSQDACKALMLKVGGSGTMAVHMENIHIPPG